MKKHYGSILVSGLILMGSLLIFIQSGRFNFPDSSDFARKFEYYEKYKHISNEQYIAMNKRDRPDLAILQEFEMTKDPKLGYPPSERKLAAFEVAKKKLARKANQRGIEGIVWNERGPTNVGGRTRALFFDPNDIENKRVFAAGVSGGIWFNNDITNRHSTWVPINDFLANIAVTTMAYDPNNTEVFYAGTGETFANTGLQGAGIFKSTDAGLTWERLESSSGFEFNQKIVVTSQSTILAATLGGLKRSTDEGKTWSSPSGVEGEMADLEIATNGDIFLGGFNGLIYKSIDDGRTWDSKSPANGGQRVEIGVAPSDANVLYAVSNIERDINWVVKSIDGGNTWQELPVPRYTEQHCGLQDRDFTRGQANYNLIIGVSPVDPDLVLIGGIDILRSINGGSDWELISYWTGLCDILVHADQHAIAFRPGHPTEAIFGNDGGVYYSSNAGVSSADPDFIAMNSDYNITQFYSVAMAGGRGSNYMLAGAQDNGTQRFRNLGTNETDEITDGDGGFCFIDQDNFDIQITSYIGNSYYLSLDAGDILYSFGVGVNVGNFINPADYDNEAGILYTRGDTRELIRYSNLAAGQDNIITDRITVQIGAANFLSALLATPHTPNRLFLGTTDGSIFRIDNASSETPELTEIGFPENGNVSSIEVGQTDDELLVTYSNYGITSVWYSADGGDNWQNKEGDLPDMPVYWGMFSPNGTHEVLLATDVGVWSVDDLTVDSPEWEPTNEGLANTSCRMLQHRASDNQIAVATFGRGVFTTYSFSNQLIPNFKLSNAVSYVGHKQTFTNHSSGSVSDVFWDFGDGTTSTQVNSTHTYGAPGEYLVSLSLNQGETISRKKINIVVNKNAVYATDFETDQSDFQPHTVRGSSWVLGNSDVNRKNGTSSGEFAWVIDPLESTYKNNSLAYLYTPQFAFSKIGSYSLSFEAQFNLEVDVPAGAWDAFWVEYTIDHGATWTKLGTEVEDGWYTTNLLTFPNGPVFGGVSRGFETKTKDVSMLAGNESVAFRIPFQSNSFGIDTGVAIDDFQITGPESIAEADFLSNFSGDELCVGEHVTFFNNSKGTVTDYSWDFGNGAVPNTATGPGPHVVTYATTGLKDISLTVTGSLNGTVTESKAGFIKVKQGLNVSNTLSAEEIATCETNSTNIVVVQSNEGISYQLFNHDTKDPIGNAHVGDGTDLKLNTGALMKDTNFHVEAFDSPVGCSLILDQIVFVTVEGPFERPFAADETIICSGESVNITITNAQAGMSYQLVDHENGRTLGDALEGADEDLVLNSGAISDTLFISIVATNINLACERTLNTTIKINVKPLPFPIITQKANLDLEAEDSFEEYQWFLNGEKLLARANLRTYTPLTSGEYTIRVTGKNGCQGLSDPFIVMVTGLKDELVRSLNIYPNPSHGIFTISHESLQQVNIYQLGGLLIHSEKVELKKTRVDLSDHPKGVYIMKLTIGDQTFTKRIALSN